MTYDKDEKIAEFSAWARDNLQQLLTEPSPYVAERLYAALSLIDDRLGVEVSGEAVNGARELIVTAFSNSQLFPVVNRIVSVLSAFPAWRPVALKPARGFNFRLSIGSHQLDASRLSFAKIHGMNGGFQLVVPEAIFRDLPTDQNREELAWLIVETGVGEEAAARISHLEFIDDVTVDQAKPISELTRECA